MCSTFLFLPERGSKNMNTFAHTFICLNKTQAVKISKHPCSSIQEGENGVKATRGKLYFLCCFIHLTEEPANALANSKTKLNMSIYHIECHGLVALKHRIRMNTLRSYILRINRKSNQTMLSNHIGGNNIVFIFCKLSNVSRL